MMNVTIYRAITIEENSVTHASSCFCSTKEKVLEMIEKDVQNYTVCGAAVTDFPKNSAINVAVNDGCTQDSWTSVVLVKDITDRIGSKKALGYATYPLI